MRYTGYQWQLMNMEDLNKDSFIDFCDKSFYNLDRFEITVEEARESKGIKDEIQRFENYIKEYEKEIKEKSNTIDSESLKKQYDTCVLDKKESNKKYLDKYIKEKNKYIKILEYVKEFKGKALDYIWEGFDEPELFQENIMSFEEWVKYYLDISNAHVMIERYKSYIKDSERELEESNKVIKEYEKIKKDFINNKQIF